MQKITRVNWLVFLIGLLSLSACSRRPQALFIPDRSESSARLSLSSTTTQPASVASLPADTARLPVGVVTASTAPDITRYQRLSVRTHRPARLVAMKSAQSEPVKVSSRATRKQLRQQLTQQGASVSGLAIASLICGILAFFVFGIVLGILAIIFGGVALSKIRKNPEIGGRGMAVAGLVLGIIATVITVIVLASR